MKNQDLYIYIYISFFFIDSECKRLKYPLKIKLFEFKYIKFNLYNKFR